MGMICFGAAAERGWTTYSIKRVPRPGRGRKQLVAIKLHVGPGDDGAPMVTIMQPYED